MRHILITIAVLITCATMANAQIGMTIQGSGLGRPSRNFYNANLVADTNHTHNQGLYNIVINNGDEWQWLGIDNWTVTADQTAVITSEQTASMDANITTISGGRGTIYNNIGLLAQAGSVDVGDCIDPSPGARTRWDAVANNITNYSAATVLGLNPSGAAAQELWFASPAGYNVKLSAPISMSANYSLRWPSAQGGASTVLTNDGAGNLSWTAGGGGGGTNWSTASHTATGNWTQSGAGNDLTVTGYNALNFDANALILNSTGSNSYVGVLANHSYVQGNDYVNILAGNESVRLLTTSDYPVEVRPGVTGGSGNSQWFSVGAYNSTNADYVYNSFMTDSTQNATLHYVLPKAAAKPAQSLQNSVDNTTIWNDALMSGWFPSGGGSTNTNTTGITTGANGTAVGATITATSAKTSARRLTQQSNAVANASAGIAVSQPFVLGGNASYMGGWRMVAYFSPTLIASTSRLIVGATTTFNNSIDPSAYANIVCIGADGGDTNLQFITRGASGSATKTDLGIAKTNTTTWYRATIWTTPNSGIYYWELFNMDTRAVVSSGFHTTNLPPNTTPLAPYVNINTGAGTAAVSIDIGAIRIFDLMN